MTRLPRLTPQELDAAQRVLYDAIAGGPRANGPQLFALTDSEGRLNGPFNAMLHAPAVGSALQELGSALRYRSTLSDRVREMSILIVAAHWDSAFEQYAHEPIGQAAGLSDAQLTAIRSGAAPELSDPTEAAAVDLVTALVATGDVDDTLFGRAVSLNGMEAVVELTTLVGYYATLALQLRVFRVGQPGDPS
ncbi:carboxymuconolactone decarboxylase family protein [Streptomyces shenzhenensis]|uniref:carboxymuconolactone decarboxylase family protein n=1 Tax=Streptomyces shenzhenensis TaxID=943815 RepID=UPI0015F0251B|nr:carboxymuconolactone decarboxylase family protein [Streptomyces shenzhenensis]